MKRLSEHRSLVAIDPTKTGLTYVFFEDGYLTAWENIGRNGDGDELSILDKILDGYAADILILEDPADARCRRRPHAKNTLRAMTAHARRRGFVVRLVGADEARRTWRTHGVRNKQAVAGAIAKRYPELAPLVPSPRRNFDSEDERVNVFDAISLVLHAYGDVAELAR